MNHNKIPSNPSEAFAHDSHVHDSAEEKTYDERTTERESPLDGKYREAAAYAAKPWMDVAVDLHDAKNAANAELLDEGETVYDIDKQGSLDSVVKYGERRAYAATEGRRDEALTPDEETLLDAYKAEAQMEHARALCDEDELTDTQMDDAWRMADAQAKAARERGDKAEMARWREVKSMMHDFQNLRNGEVEEDEKYAIEKRVRPHAGDNAGFVLDTLGNDGVVVGEYAKYAKAAQKDTHNMRRMADVYELFGAAQAQEASVGTPEKTPAVDKEKILKKYGEYKDVHDAAEATLDYDAMLDDGEDGFAGARQKIETQLQHYRGQGAAGSVHVARLERLQQSLPSYIEDVHRGSDTFPAVSADLRAARGRSEVMKFLAKQYPKQEKSTTANEPTNAARAEQQRATQVESARQAAYAAAAEAFEPPQVENKGEKSDVYDPDDTIIPTDERGLTVRRRNAANNYFADVAHQEFTPENIKVLKDYMIHELRGVIDYNKRRFNRATVGNQAAVFGTVFTLDDLDRPDRTATKFAYELVKQNMRPGLMYAEFEQMSLKDVATAVGFDITKYIDGYDTSVAPYVGKKVHEEKPGKTPPMR